MYCCEDKKGFGNFTYIRFATDINGSNISKDKDTDGIERCYQAVIVSDNELDENSSTFVNYFFNKWFKICDDEDGTTNPNICEFYGYHTPVSLIKSNTWIIDGSQETYQFQDTVKNRILISNQSNNDFVHIRGFTGKGGLPLKNNESYYVEFDYDFRNLPLNSDITLSFGEGDQATRVIFNKQQSGRYVGIIKTNALNENVTDQDDLVIEFNLDQPLGNEQLIIENIRIASQGCFGSDNKPKVINFGIVSNIGDGTVDVAGAINNLPENSSFPDYKSVTSEEDHYFEGIFYPAERSMKSYRRVYKVKGRGKGVYGQNGNIVVSNKELFIIENDLLTDDRPPIITDDPNARLEDLGDIPDGDYLSVINSQANPYFTIEQDTNWYFEYTQDGNKTILTFQGELGTYGDGQLQTVEDDLFVIYSEVVGGDDYVIKDELAEVAFSGDYNDLDNLPNISDFVTIDNNETIISVKTFNSSTGGGLVFENTGSLSSIFMQNSSSGRGLNAINSGTGYGIYQTNTDSGVGIYSQNSANGIGLDIDNSSSGIGIDLTNTGTGIGFRLVNSSNANLIDINNNLGVTGKTISSKLNGVENFSLNSNGNIIASTLALFGGKGNNILLDNGTTTPLSNLNPFEGYAESGTRAGGDLIITLLDYDDSGNGIKVTLDQDGESIDTNASIRSTQSIITPTLAFQSGGFVSTIQTNGVSNNNFILPNSGATFRTIPVSVNGYYADSLGNITVAVGSSNSYSETFGNGEATTITINHNLNAEDLTSVIIKEVSTGEHIITTVTETDNNNVQLNFTTAPTTNQYRITITG